MDSVFIMETLSPMFISSYGRNCPHFLSLEGLSDRYLPAIHEDMASPLQQDLAQLASLAYRRDEWQAEEVRRYHSLLRKKGGKKAVAAIEHLYQWMLTPVTLWPINIHSVMVVCLDNLEAGQPLDEEMKFLLDHLAPLPSEEVFKVVSDHEHLVWKGGYESLVNTTAKFNSIQKDAERNPDILDAWKKFKSHWDVSKFADHKGVIRRSLTTERNLRETFAVDWDDPNAHFQAAFDLFCHRWNLYGMEFDKPLVMKLSVNLTAFGTMIFIPTYWSLDAKRDVKWDEVNKFHKARSLKKQGESLAESHEERRRWAAKLRKLDAEAKQKKLKGEALHLFISKGLGWVDRTDTAKRAARLRKEFPEER